MSYTGPFLLCADSTGEKQIKWPFTSETENVELTTFLCTEKSNPQMEKREVFERNIRAEGLQMEKEVNGLHE